MKQKVLVTGGSGMVGRHLQDLKFDAEYIGTKDCDLTNSNDTEKLFKKIKPDVVIHLAARVGGIMDNIKNPVAYLEDNISINSNTIRYAYANKCERFVGILSTCIYPDKLEDSLYPLSESNLHDGLPPKSNFSYAYAKRCMDVHIKSYRSQYGLKYSSIIPCNLYSEYDHFGQEKSHFVTSIISKIVQAKINNTNKIELFGTGTPLRQFMYAGDLARAIAQYIESDYCEDFNVATNEVYTISQIAKIVLDACDASDMEIVWDKNRPDGQFRKDASDKKFKSMFPNFQYTSLYDGVKKTYNTYYEMVTKRI